MDSPAVNILLSTHDGGQFLPCLLDSLLAQDHRRISILVRDDGSRDNTVDTIRRYASRDGRIRFLNDPGEGQSMGIGYRDSFMALLGSDDSAQYYAFCDQDDFWLPEKVRLGVEALEEAAKDTPHRPMLYTSACQYCDGELRKTATPTATGIAPPFEQTLFYNSALGFTILMNRALRDLVIRFAPPCPGIPHDKLAVQLALLFGRYIADPRRTALYRRHGATVTTTTGSALRLLRTWVANDIFGSTMEYYRRHARELRAALEAEGGAPESALRLLSLFEGGAGARFGWFRRLLFPKRLRPTLPGELALRLCFLIGR